MYLITFLKTRFLQNNVYNFSYKPEASPCLMLIEMGFTFNRLVIFRRFSARKSNPGFPGGESPHYPSAMALTSFYSVRVKFMRVNLNLRYRVFKYIPISNKLIITTYIFRLET